MSYRTEYEKWLASDKISDAERAELLAIANDEKEIESRFFAPLSFGTAGLRGVLGAGINRMNVHTVRQATQGLASLICSMGKDAMEKGVAIAMDCRICSDEFAKEAAKVLAGNGIKVYLFESLRPTPELSFAILTIGTIAGINITASHNPKEYNGYKAYWSDGAQLPPKQAGIVAEEIAKCDIFEGIKSMDLEKAVKKGIVTIIGEEVDEAFLHHAYAMAINKEAVAKIADDFKVVFTPFHGTGWKLVPDILRRIGIKNIITVDEQMVIDGNFPTVKSPNPENKEGFTRAIEIAKENGVDLIIGTDPDADRVGVVVRAGDDYVTISGNQMGVLLLDYIITARRETNTMPEKPVALKTIVTTELARIVCEKNGIEIYDTFTGFKFLAEKINALQKDGYEYLLAYEESYGYLMGDYARDKDAVTASMMIAEMAAYYAGRGMNLYDAMCSIYERYGYFAESTISIVMPGVDGLRDMARLMANLRENPPKEIAGVAVKALRDYQSGERRVFGGETEKMELSGSNVLYFEMADGTSFIVRPSGTEPKVKVYIMVSGADAAECDAKVAAFSDAANALAK
ncbi:MAG: phospho-sugar mutase [Clostridia bacterium]|nr:phospho-sugar mutase [Clostridia bacterium]